MKITDWIALLIPFIASMPGILALILQRKKDNAEAAEKLANARKTDSSASIDVSSNALQWATEFRTQMNVMRENMEQIQKDLIQSRSEALSAKSELLAARGEVIAVQQENARLKSDVAKLQSELTAVMQQNKELVDKLNFLEQENAELKSQVHKINGYTENQV